MNIKSTPFLHSVTDGLWDDDLLRKVVSEFPVESDRRWKGYFNDKEGKFEGGPHMFGESTRLLLEEMEALGPQLSELYGIRDLEMRTIGGGFHCIPPGGKLAIHADFNRSTDGLYRRLNMLIYLNEGWTDADGGYLELWDENTCVEKILPVFNRTVTFSTSSTSFHGHPVPLPGPRSRLSFAAYFFSPEPASDYVKDHSTVWRNG